MSSIRANTISAANGTDPVTLTKQSAAKVWAGQVSDSAVALDSFGVSSITDSGTGLNTLNFSNSFDSSGYSSVASAGYTTATLLNRTVFCASKSTTSVKMGTFVASTDAASSIQQNVILQGDLA